ncbi:hypothetical protein [Nocardioides immobilis]|uniref:hypothetical protein n=1 Tax=Nocardioides immobilis TaxID=2049295 RepID=UPI0011C40278|nr:hypothetical protein [Nocardioides immobilis]
MALHDELADLRAQVGPQIFDDPVAFRAAFDDFVSEGSASTGEVSLLVGAIATGALQRLKDQLALGADPATSIAAQGDLLARDRGTSESDGARWALSVLAHASGAIPADLVLTRPAVPDSLSTPDRPTGSGSDVVDPGPTHRPTVDRAGPSPTAFGDATRVAGKEPSPDPHRPTAAAPEPGRPGGRRTNPLLLGAVAVLAVVAIVAVALLFLRDDDSPDNTADDQATSDGGDSGAPGSEDLLDEIEMSEAGKTVRVQLVRDDTEAFLVLLAEHEGDYTEVDRTPTSCPFLDTAYDAVIQDQGGRQLFWGWQNNGTEGYGEYGEVQIDEEMLIPFGIDAPCPGDG